jgi:hypothetical protein
MSIVREQGSCYFYGFWQRYGLKRCVRRKSSTKSNPNPILSALAPQSKALLAAVLNMVTELCDQGIRRSDNPCSIRDGGASLCTYVIGFASFTCSGEMSGREQVRDDNSLHVQRSGCALVAVLIDQRKVNRTITVHHRLHCARKFAVLTPLKLFDRRERRTRCKMRPGGRSP